jgi:hypothetical protein
MLCAEVFSGASVLWFLSFWGWLVTFPLYLVHLVFLFSLAVLFHRVSLTSLYSWGVIFGLYESWITKVTHAGYIGTAGPGWGTFLGFAFPEFFIIVLFWHPVMSFILPLVLFEIFSGSHRRDTLLLFGHSRLVGKGRITTAIFSGIALIGAAFLSVNSGFSLAAALITFLWTVLFIAALYEAVLRQTGGSFSVSSLVLKRTGLVIAAAYLILLYLATFFVLVPERIPPLSTLFLTVVIYAFVVVMLWIDRPAAQPSPVSEFTGTRIMVQDLLGMGGSHRS